MDQSGRLHAFDNLRAIMMWLGIVLHVTLNHLNGPSPMPWRDTQVTPLADLLLVFIHAFRMPVFFIIAGYFVALLVARRGYQGMLRHRLRRLALPFLVFWPLLIVSTTLLMLVYLHLMVYGTAGVDLGLITKKGRPPPSPFNTMHMWFMYYLIWLCVLCAAFAPLIARVPERVKRGADALFLALTGRWWGAVVLTIPLAIIGASYRVGMLAPDGSFIPNLKETVHFGLFFVAGLYLHRHQDVLFPQFVRRCWRNIVLGCVSFVLVLGLVGQYAKHPAAVPHIEAWIAFLYSQPFGPLTKMALNILATTAVCLLSYQLLVRPTFVGVLLNGRRQPRAGGLAVPAAAEPK